MQNVHFTPPELAPLFAVNVSTIKRWIDAGLLSAEVTPGGHRRVSREALHAFLRHSPNIARRSYVLQRLGRPEPAGIYWTSYYQLLLRGRDRAAREYLEQTYIRTRDVAALIDQVISPTLAEIGRGWQAGTLSILDEHRMSFLIRGHILLLDNLTASRSTPGRRAVLACVNGEQHEMILHLLGLVLRHRGWTVDSLGINTPVRALTTYIRQHHYQLVGLSKLYSAVRSEHYLKTAITAARRYRTFVCYGGRGWPAVTHQQTQASAYLGNMQEFVTLLEKLEHPRQKR